MAHTPIPILYAEGNPESLSGIAAFGPGYSAGVCRPLRSRKFLLPVPEHDGRCLLASFQSPRQCEQIALPWLRLLGVAGYDA